MFVGLEGCQIDLLLQTRRSACVVEIKRRREIGVYFDAIVPFRTLLGL